MNTHNQILNTNKNLHVQRYKQGFRLVESRSDEVRAPNSLASLLDLPVSVYFYDTENKFVQINEQCAVLIDAVSAADAQGKNPSNFCSREFSEKIFSIGDSVIRNQSTHIIEEIGFRADDFLIQALAVKLPWYHEDNIIGLLGFSIYTDNNSVSEFAGRMASVLATSLLGASSISNIIPMISHEDVYFSKREAEVLSYLLRGYTAKMIGERMHISKRTVEHHIEHIKHKSGCMSKFDLIKKYYGQID